MLFQPLPVMGEEPSRLGWHVVMYRHALTRVQAACVTGHEQVVVEQQYAAVRGTQPQRITGSEAQ